MSNKKPEDQTTKIIKNQRKPRRRIFYHSYQLKSDDWLIEMNREAERHNHHIREDKCQ